MTLNLPVLGNGLAFLADGMHPDTTFARLHEQYGPRYIVNVPGQGTLLVTCDPDDIPIIARPGDAVVTKRDDPPFPWNEIWLAHPERDLTYTWMSDQQYVEGIGMFKDALGMGERAIERFATHMMWNINRLLHRIAATRSAMTTSVPNLKELYFSFLIDPSIQLTCGKDLQFTLRDKSDFGADLQFFYEAVLKLGTNALEVSRNPLNHAVHTRAYETCAAYWQSLYGHAQRWYDELVAARDLGGGEWPEAVARDKCLFLDMYEDYFQKNLCDEARLVCNIVEFVIGTADPGAQLIENILFQLTQHGDSQEAIYSEIERVFGRNEPIETFNFAQWQSLEMFRAFVAETCRFMPLFTIHMRRTVETTTLADGAVLPAGFKVIFNYAAMSSSSVNYPEPDKFMPDRFFSLPELPARRGPRSSGPCPFAAGKINNIEAVVPFGLGDRACAGIGWAQAITGMAVVSIIRRYKVTYDGPLDVAYHGSTPNHPVKPLDDYFKFELRDRGQG